jgi:hypothetical protein
MDTSSSVFGSPAPRRRAKAFQFSLATMVFACAYVSLVLGWIRWTWNDYGWTIYYPGALGMCSLGILGVAYCHLRGNSLPMSAWNLIAIAWLVVIANVFYGLMRSFMVTSCEGPRLFWQLLWESLYLSIVSAITLPLFCTIPAVYLLVLRDRAPPVLSAWRVHLALIIAVLDAISCIALVYAASQAW